MKNTIPEVDAYIDGAAGFAQPILRKLRRLFHQSCPEIQETIKWSSPFFEYKGIVGNMTAFKRHVSYGFWKTSLMRDPEGLLEKAGNTEMAVLKAANLNDLPADEILIQCIQEAADLNKRGIKIPRPRRAERRENLVVPNDLEEALGQNEKARVAFAAFSPSHRKEYVEWLTEAKREATRLRRLQTAVEWISEGKPRNWKYMKEWR